MQNVVSNMCEKFHYDRLKKPQILGQWKSDNNRKKNNNKKNNVRTVSGSKTISVADWRAPKVRII